MKKSGNNLRVPRYLRHVSGLFCSHKKKNFSFKFFPQTKNNILQKLLLQSK